MELFVTEPKPPINAPRSDATQNPEALALAQFEAFETDDTSSQSLSDSDLSPEGDATEVFHVESLVPSVVPTPPEAVDFSSLSLDDAELEAALGFLSDPPPPLGDGESVEVIEAAVPAAESLEALPDPPGEAVVEAAVVEAAVVEAAVVEAAVVEAAVVEAAVVEAPVGEAFEQADEELSAEEVTALEPSDLAGEPEFEGETELVFEDDDDAEVEIEMVEAPSAPDRGAMLAATVTSRSRRVDVGELAFTADARAEVLARAELLIEQAEHADDPREAAELLALAGDLLDVGTGDRTRGRALALEALARDPGCLFASRLMRRFALAEGDLGLALDRCVQESELAMGDEERSVLWALTGELATGLDPEQAAAAWTESSRHEGPFGALYGLFAAAQRRDPAEIGGALATLSARTEGVLSAAVNVARARLSEGAAETEAALSAIREAVSRDGTDAGAWLAMARIGLSRASAAVFRDALRGLSAAGGAGHMAVASGSLLRALDGVLGDTSDPSVVDDAGVVGWLVAHAARDADAQVKASSALGGERPEQWLAKSGGDLGDAGRFHAVRLLRASDPGWAGAASRFVGGETSLRAAGLAARASGVTADEADAVAEASSGGVSVISLGLRTAATGIPGATWPASPETSGWHRVAWIDRTAHEGSRAEALTALGELDEHDVPLGVTVFASRMEAALRGDDPAVARALRREALLASDPQRGSAQMLLASAFAAGVNHPGGARDALEAARGLGADLAAAELVGLFSQRGEAEAEAAAALFDQAAQGLKGMPSRVAQVRAALRRGGTDTEAAAASVWRLWQKGDADAALGVLVLRASAGFPDRAMSVVRAQADRAQGASGGAGVAVWLQLTAMCELAAKHADAVQAVARARTLSLSDASLAQTEERLWLKAGLFAEVAERAFDRVKAAEDDEQRVAAYERLAELDRTFRGDVASSVLSYQAILELAPGHMASLRTLERYFLENGRFEELLGIYERLVRYSQDPEDAVATAHMAARIASLQADGGVGAGAEFLKLAMDRQSTDRRMLMALELECRRTGDLSRFADVQLLAMDLATDPAEIATHGCRAGESLAALGLRADALRAYERAVNALPGHPVALAGMAREQDAAGDAAGAASTMESLARVLVVPEHAIGCFLRAASVWQSLGERELSLAAAKSVLALDAQNLEAFDRAMGLLRDADDRAGELELIERRTADTGDVGFASLLVRAAELSEELGDTARALGHWRAVHGLLPDHDGALRSIARLSVALEGWASAADAMIRLARVLTDRAERAEIFFALGDIYDAHLPDPRRAEAAWRRVVQLVPDDDRTLARLADLYARIGDAALEADAVEARAKLAETSEARLALLLRLARVLDQGVKDAARAEAAFEAARMERPADLEMLRAYSNFYEAQGATVARQVLLDRAANDLRPEIDADPMEAAKMSLMADIHEMRGRSDGARLVGAVSVSLGSPNEQMRVLAPLGCVPGAGAGTLNPEVLELLSPPSVFLALRELLSRAGDVIEKVMPFDPRPMRAEKLGARSHPLKAEAERWAKLLGLGPVELYLGPQMPGVCVAVSRTPCAVVVPATAMATAATRFAMARAMLLNALYLAPALRLPPHELTLVLNAVLRQFEPMYRAPDVDLAELDDLARKVARLLPRDRHAELSPLAFEVIEANGCHGDVIQAGTQELGNRLALLGTGDVAGAIAALAPEGIPAATAFRDVVAVSRLVRVALSERFIEARQLAGADKL